MQAKQSALLQKKTSIIIVYSKLHVINGLSKIALLYHYYKHLYSFFYISTECLAWEFIQR